MLSIDVMICFHIIIKDHSLSNFASSYIQHESPSSTAKIKHRFPVIGKPAQQSSLQLETLRNTLLEDLRFTGHLY